MNAGTRGRHLPVCCGRSIAEGSLYDAATQRCIKPCKETWQCLHIQSATCRNCTGKRLMVQNLHKWHVEHDEEDLSRDTYAASAAAVADSSSDGAVEIVDDVASDVSPAAQRDAVEATVSG